LYPARCSASCVSGNARRIGERAAGSYLLIGTAKLNGIDPEAYLRFVLERVAEYPIQPRR
jgi:hypothetical protein